MSERTELEGCVLGVVWQRGPCTAYTVRQEFLKSLSSHWSGSAGAIYPLLRRLENLGLIAAQNLAWGTGGKKEFSVTPQGMEVLRKWIGPPLPDWTASPTFDPIRTRLTFLESLTPARRKRFLADARRNVDREIERVKERMKSDEGMERLVTLGGLRELEGRRKWLDDVTRSLSV